MIEITLETQLSEKVRSFLRECKVENPFLSEAFFDALTQSKALGDSSGWYPLFIFLTDAGRETMMPAFVKTHSYAEYVFDWQWADAYARLNMDYYPKLLVALAYTPVPCSKLLGERPRLDLEIPAVFDEVCRELKLASWHYLFSVEDDYDYFSKAIQRASVAFLWKNHDYSSFSEFLATLKMKQRKAIKRERRSIAEQGVTLERIEGKDINEELLAFFFRCYQQTYRERGQREYLDRDFFQYYLKHAPESVMLCVARYDHELIAASWFFKSSDRLYGRYWGSIYAIDNLHFECCYYQGIEYCIEQGLNSFDPGTQGEHKVRRGFEPSLSYSFHNVLEDRLRDPIARYCQEDVVGTKAYLERLSSSLPFKTD